jgi:hypothetical protein
MAKKPEPPMTWTIYKIVAKQIGVGTVEAPDETTATRRRPLNSGFPPPSFTLCGDDPQERNPP